MRPIYRKFRAQYFFIIQFSGGAFNKRTPVNRVISDILYSTKTLRMPRLIFAKMNSNFCRGAATVYCDFWNTLCLELFDKEEKVEDVNGVLT